ncbi:MAG: hypothetical protein GX621_02385 [Pirellulaceae bacterium]|nr:hypothetical protein [Pirellulaceae bacterium]
MRRILGMRFIALAVILLPWLAPRADAERPKYVPHPSLDEIEQGLERWAEFRPDRIKLETVGRSAAGHPMLLAIVTDRGVPDEDKQVVLLTVSHGGSELTGCTGFLHLTRWLVGDDPAAAKIRRNVVTLIMPVLNPDGYAGMRDDNPRGPMSCHNNSNDVDIYLAFDWDGPRDPAKAPEAAALFAVAEKYRPDASFDVHGCWFDGHSMWESTAMSWIDSRAHTYCPALAEEMNLAAEKEGFLMVRPTEDAGRIKVTAPVEGAGRHHFYETDNRLSLMTFLYHRYHTLAINAEAGYDASVVARTKKLLELGTTRWRNEFYTGYPTNQVGCWGSMSICAWGETAAQRRRSRVELWRNSERIYYSLGFDQPANEKLMAVCATNVPAAKRWLGDGKMSTILNAIKDHPRIDAEAISQFVEGTLMTRGVPDPLKRTHRRGYNPQNTSEEPIEHGLAVRLFIPYVDARIVDARINGHPVAESAADGYQVRHGPGTIVQFNIPPGKVDDVHFVTCEYRTEKPHRQGFQPEDWELTNASDQK